MPDKGTADFIKELKSGYLDDPHESARELARLDELCQKAAIRLGLEEEKYKLKEDECEKTYRLVQYLDNDPFKVLNKINVNQHIEKKNNLSYLSWAWAWQTLMELYPESYTEINRPENGFPYWTDGKTCWVDVSVTIVWYDTVFCNEEKRTRSEVFPIMDYKNNSIPVEKLTSFNVNTALQRAWTKCTARHGLGFYIYAGEDLPKEEAEAKKAEAEAPCSDEQIAKVKELYTADEITKMLKRLKKSYLSEVTKEQAEKMIAKRDISLVASQVNPF